MPTPSHCHPSGGKSSRNFREERVRDVNVIHATPLARVDHGGLNRLAGSGASDADL